MGSDDAKDDEGSSPSVVSSLVATLFCVIRAVALTLFTTRTPKAGLTKSAVFLIAFVIIHAAGNSALFQGRDAFNEYAEFLHSQPLLILVELYLACGAALHILSGLWLTFTVKYKRTRVIPGPNFNLDTATLIFTGSFLGGFLVWHVLEFRLAANETRATKDGGSYRDIYTDQLKVFASPAKVAFYEIAVVMLGMHLWRGWSNTVQSPDFQLERGHRWVALLLGRFLTLLLCAVFSACPLYAHTLAVKS